MAGSITTMTGASSTMGTFQKTNSGQLPRRKSIAGCLRSPRLAGEMMTNPVLHPLSKSFGGCQTLCHHPVSACNLTAAWDFQDCNAVSGLLFGLSGHLHHSRMSLGIQALLLKLHPCHGSRGSSRQKTCELLRRMAGLEMGTLENHCMHT